MTGGTPSSLYLAACLCDSIGPSPTSTPLVGQPATGVPSGACLARPGQRSRLLLRLSADAQLPAMSSYRYGRPALKNSVDVQLQTAFSDGNWATVIRLATKRAAALKDPYYEVCVTISLVVHPSTDRCSHQLWYPIGYQDLRAVAARRHGREVCRAGRR